MEENTNEQNKMNPMLVGGIVVALLIVGAVVLLGMGASNTGETPESMATETAENTPAGEDTMTAENIIEVEGGAFYYKPNEIRVKAGEPVTIKLNAVDMQHDFVIDELNVRTEITQGGNSGAVTFTPTEPGEYTFYCSVGQHRANGMEGTLIVE